MAYELEKPICFIMMGDFPESVLPDLIKRLLKTNVIARMEFVDEQPQFKSPLEHFCNTMIEMVGSNDQNTEHRL